MTKSSKIIIVLFLILVLAGLVIYCVACGKSTAESAVQTAEQTNSASADEVLAEAQTLVSLAQAAYDNQTAICITLADGNSSATVSSVQIENDIVTLTAGGIYQVSGALTDGQIIINTEDAVTLILDGIDIAKTTDAAINVSNAEHILIYLPDGSENTIVSGVEQEITAANENSALNTAEGAALYAKDNLSFAGNGILYIGGYINNGVATTDRLTLLGGKLNIAALNNGFKGKDSVLIIDGTLNITSDSSLFSGKRVHRGHYQCVDGRCPNADVNSVEYPAQK